MAIDYDAIGLRIKIARIKAKMTQEKLAEQVGLSTAHISNIETGNTKLSLSTIVKLANALTVSVDELLCDSIINSSYVYSREAQETLLDCSPYEIRILLDILKSTKEALRKDQRFKESLKDNVQK